jgi:orotidine-5'-phosphate decarboxylase
VICENPGIVIACDVATLEALDRLVEATSAVPQVTGFKIGFSLGLRFGLAAVAQRIRKKSDKPIIYDHQKGGTDIPQMGRTFADVCEDAGINGAILFPHSGPATLEAWLDALLEKRIVPLVGCVMTHPRFLASEGGFIVDDAYRQVYPICLEKGVAHFIVPATKPQHVATLRREAERFGKRDIAILSPGIGRQKADIEAVRRCFAGLNWSPIVGAAIYDSDDPAREVRRIAVELGLTSQ